jgi:hypothetical protein
LNLITSKRIDSAYIRSKPSFLTEIGAESNLRQFVIDFEPSLEESEVERFRELFADALQEQGVQIIIHDVQKRGISISGSRVTLVTVTVRTDILPIAPKESAEFGLQQLFEYLILLFTGDQPYAPWVKAIYKAFEQSLIALESPASP